METLTWSCFFSGAVLLDLKQTTLPGIAQQVVEQLVISDQIKATDRADVLRALLLRHRSSLEFVCSNTATIVTPSH